MKKLYSVLLTLIVLVSMLISPALVYAQNTTNNIFTSNTLYVDTESEAYRNYKTTNSEQLKKIAEVPQARWFTGWESNIKESVNSYVSKAASLNKLPVLVAYNLPFRDCGGYSGGGSSNSDSYKRWISSFIEGIGSNKAVVIFEPDGLGLIECGGTILKNARFELYKYATDKFSTKSNIAVYLDASMWIAPAKMAEYLNKAGIDKVRGISVNVSNFKSNKESTEYIQKVKTALGKDIYGVIDTSRNGVESLSSEWCNPTNKGLGIPSTGNTGNSLIDAFLWIKRPGESDGRCNGGPDAGKWWESYALSLVSKAVNTTVTAEAPVVESPKDSTLTIYAAGTSVDGIYPTIELFIKDQKVKTINNVTGNPYTKSLVNFSYSQLNKINVEDITIKFVNDASNNYEDRNLLIDRINIDGTDYQTEDANNYSVGTWSSDNGCNGGFKKSEWLHCGGYVKFKYSNAEVNSYPKTSSITIYAAGTSVNGVYPTIELYIGNNKVKTFTNIKGDPYSKATIELSYSHSSAINISDVVIKYTNDYSTATEDRNLLVDKVVIDEKIYQTESATTFSTGTWAPGTNCNPGYKSSEWLHCGGLLDFD